MMGTLLLLSVNVVFDCWELTQEQHAYAQEAKEFTKRHCHKKESYLDIHGTDKYGRLLAIVWIPLVDMNQHISMTLYFSM
jgi:endonuclease YncB( thermonuclease family)